MSGSIIFTVPCELFLASYVYQSHILFGNTSYFWQHCLCCHALGAIPGSVSYCCAILAVSFVIVHIELLLASHLLLCHVSCVWQCNLLMGNTSYF